MAFTATVHEKVGHAGSLRIVVGTYVSDGGDTGGDIKTGLTEVIFFIPSEFASAVVTSAPAVNESATTFTNAGGVVTIVTAANKTGSFVAIGY